MDDKTIISIAQNEDYIIVTKDKDFQSHYLLNGYPPAVLWLSFGNVSNAGLLSMLSTNFDVIEDALISGGRMVVLASDRVMIW